MYAPIAFCLLCNLRSVVRFWGVARKSAGGQREKNTNAFFIYLQAVPVPRVLADSFQSQISGLASVKIYLCYLSLEKTADIFRRGWFPPKMTSDGRAQKFHSDYGITALIKIVLPIGRGKFPRDTTNQRHYTVLGNDTSSVRNFCACLWGVIRINFQFSCSVVLFCCFLLLFCHTVLTFYRSVV